MFERLAISDIILVTPKRHGDDRGFFAETYREQDYRDAGIAGRFVQDNHAYSKDAGVLRGLHYQIPPHAQGKLVSCLHGEILDVAVDLRRGSPTYGQHVSIRLSANTGQQLFVPAGFAHGYLTLTEECHVQYKVTAYYDQGSEYGLAWNDPSLGIDWHLGDRSPILSDKDRAQPLLEDLPAYFDYAAYSGED